MSKQYPNNNKGPNGQSKVKHQVNSLMKHFKWTVIATKSKEDMLMPLDMVLSIWYKVKAEGGDLSRAKWQGVMQRVFTGINEELFENRLTEAAVEELSKIFRNPVVLYLYYIQSFNVQDDRGNIMVNRNNVDKVVQGWNSQYRK